MLLRGLLNVVVMLMVAERRNEAAAGGTNWVVIDSHFDLTQGHSPDEWEIATASGEYEPSSDVSGDLFCPRHAGCTGRANWTGPKH